MRIRTTAKLSEHLETTPEGYLLCREAALGRTGVMRYLPEEVSDEITDGFAGKEVLIYRDEDEVFAPEALASFEGKPLTLDHPDGNVAPENWAELARGIVSNVRRGAGANSDLVLADILVTDAEAIAAIEDGLRELSCGYDAELEPIRPGVGRQTHIRGNHVALVDHGRAGGRCKIKDEDPMATGKKKKPGWADRLRRLLKDAEAEEAAAKAADEEPPQTDEDAPPARDEEQAPATTDDDLAASLEEIKLMLRTLIEALKPQAPADGKPAKDEEPEGANDEDPCGDEDPPQDEEPGTPARDRRPARLADADTAQRAQRMGLAGARRGDNADAVRRGALALAMRDADSARLVRDILGDKPLSRASSVELAAAFGAVAAVTASDNNRRTTDSLVRPGKGAPKVWTPAAINEVNAKFYAKGGNNG